MSPAILNLMLPLAIVACQVLIIRTFKPSTFIGAVTSLFGGYLLALAVLGAIWTYILPAFLTLSIPSILEALSC